MLTTSEIAVTAAIWVLTAAGGFFGTRVAVRKKRLQCDGTKSCAITPAGRRTDKGTAETDAE